MLHARQFKASWFNHHNNRPHFVNATQEASYYAIFSFFLSLPHPPLLVRQPPVGQGLVFQGVSRSQRRTAVGMTPLDEWSARRIDLCLTTHNTQNRQTSMPAVGFEPAIPVGERLLTCALSRAATGTGSSPLRYKYFPHHLALDTLGDVPSE
jgi:hypothetical protein